MNTLKVANVLIFCLLLSCFSMAGTLSAQNIARGKVARQSKTTHSAVAARAVDGNTNGDFWQGSVTHTDNDNPWWEVDLGGIYHISEIKFFNRTDCCKERLSNYNIYVSEAPITATTPALLPGLQKYQNVNPVVFPTRATGRYVRIALKGTTVPLSLAEVEIKGTPAENIAKGKVARQSRTTHGAVAARAVDGNTSGDFSQGSVTHTDNNNPWWEVDLGAVYDINKIKLYNRTDCCKERLNNYNIYVSKSPITAATKGLLSGLQKFQNVNPVVHPTRATGRYVRVALKGTSVPLSLAEVEVYGVRPQSFHQDSFSFETDCKGASGTDAYACGALSTQDHGEKWSPGQTIKVKFLNGSARLQNKVKEIAAVWQKYGNINFQYVTSGNAEIRINFDDTKVYYYTSIGNGGHINDPAAEQREKTMQLGFDYENVEDDEIRRVVLHEFGHALGFVHEHLQAEFDIPWDYAAVICDYSKAGTDDNWEIADIKANVFDKYEKTQTNYDKPDIHSIMQYSISNKHTIGDFAINGNYELSAKDKSTAATWYPYPAGRQPKPEAATIDYQIAIQTKKEANAGTDDNIYLSIHGTEASIKDVKLNSLLKGNAFESGDLDIITLRGYKNVGKILSIKIRKGGLDNWRGEYVYISKLDQSYKFTIDGRLDGATDFRIIDSKTTTDRPYIVNISTGDQAGAGTDANVSLEIVGDKGSTGKIALNARMSGNVFERAGRDVVGFMAGDVGKVKHIVISHDNAFAAAGWFLSVVEVTAPTGKTRFECNDWLESGRLSKTLFPGVNGVSYIVDVKTGDYAGAGTDANVYLTLKGTAGESTEIRLNPFFSGNAFERNRTDQFRINARDVGAISSITIRKDNQFAGADWFLANVSVTKAGRKSYFEHEDWLTSSKRSATMTPGSPGINYVVQVQTSNVAAAGTDANVFLTIRGTGGTTKSIRLNGLMSGNVFEKGSVDQVTVKGKDVGTITGISISHDNQFAGAGWHLDNVKVYKHNLSTKPLYFAAKRWLQTGSLSASLSPSEPTVDIKVTVRTSDKGGAGTDANVYLTIYGTKGQTSEHRLNGHISGNAFESGDTDVLTLRNLKDIGSPTKIKIRHDNQFAGAGWHLSNVSIAVPNQNAKTFSCGCWMESGSLQKVLH